MAKMSLEAEMLSELRALANENDAELMRDPLAWAFYNAGCQVIRRMGARIAELERLSGEETRLNLAAERDRARGAFDMAPGQ